MPALGEKVPRTPYGGALVKHVQRRGIADGSVETIKCEGSPPKADGEEREHGKSSERFTAMGLS